MNQTKPVMKHVYGFMVCCLLTLSGWSQCASTGNIYSFTFNGQTYEVVKELQNWANAAACAVERGGYLVEINSAEENAAIFDAIINGAGVSPGYVSIGNGGGIAYVWIGATDVVAEGTWLWDGDNSGSGIHFWTGQGANGANNGVPVGGNYYNWGGTSTGTCQEPDNWGSNQDYAAMGLTGWPSGTTMLGIAGEWNDIIGSSAIYYVIEYSPTGMNPEPEGRNPAVCPNPTTGMVRVEGDGIRSVTLLDGTGRPLASSPGNSVDLTPFAPGVYFLTVVYPDARITRKVVRE